MSTSRDDFGIAFRSALLQRGAAQKFSLIIFLFFAAIIFFLDIYGFGFIKPIRSAINDGIYRVSLVASSPSRFFPQVTGRITNLLTLKKENERLKKEIEIFKQKEFNVTYLTNENKNLKKILDSDENLFEENIIISKVLIDKSSPYLKSIIINRGSKAGVLKGMPVMDKDFLIGRIVETNFVSSRVLLLNDLNSRVPVTLDSNSSQAILTGSGTNSPKLEYLPEEYEFKGEVTVYASGKDGVFTPGTPIGKTTSNSDTYSNEVKLFVDSNQLSFVTVHLLRINKENN
jgi:rod shape-determining protein MreC